MADVIVGIDLGTTNSLVAVCDARGPRIIPDAHGRALLPSVVRYERSATGHLQTIVGHDAREHAAEFPAVTIASVKRLMGRSKADAAADLPYLSYTVVEGPHNTARVSLPLGDEAVVLTPQEVSAVILRTLKEQASRELGVDVTRAVVTVPAYFDDAQRQATRDAGRLAGLEVVRIVNEPTAAALAYGLGLERSTGKASEPRVVAVYDLGGGTFDVSILRLTPAQGVVAGTQSGGGDAIGLPQFFQVLSTAGDTRLGGDDVDQMLMERFIREIDIERRRAGGTEIDHNPLSSGAMQRLRTAAESAKIALSDQDDVDVRVQADHVLYERRVTRAELEELITPWVDRTLDACSRALRDARRQMAGGAGGSGVGGGGGGGGGVDAVIMVGGSTRIPLVRQKVGAFFGLEPYTALDPDQVVALGAAVQAGIMSGAMSGALLLDVIPLSLGIETVGGAAAKIIFRNSTVPARATEMFSTSVDNQTAIKLHIVQGEREMAGDCRSLGEFTLRGLPPMPAGIPQVEVEFLVDANGILNVSAHERRSGRRASLQVVPNHGLTREEVDRMEAESLAHAREDMLRHRIVDLVVNSRLDLKWIGERLQRLRAKLDPSYAADLDARLAHLRGMVEDAQRDWRSVDADAFYKAKTDLDQASMRLQEVSIAESLREEGH